METLKRPMWIGLCFFPLFLPGTALAWRGGNYGGWAPWSCGWTGSGAWGWPGMILGIAFWVLVSMAILYLIRWIVQDTKRTRPPMPKVDSPMDILKMRYARGEISTEDFHRMGQELQ